MLDYKRILFYFTGLFIMTLGIVMSIKSNLGVSPISSVPYTFTVIWNVEIGLATVLFNCFLVFIQIILLKNNFKKKQLLQFPVSIIFGYFTTISMYIFSFIPNPDNLMISFIYMIFSILLIAFGIFMYLPADICSLPGEGLSQALSIVLNKKFSNIKVFCDSIMVILSALTCLYFINNFGSVGIGTIFSAILIGLFVGFFSDFYYLLTKKRVNLKNIG